MTADMAYSNDGWWNNCTADEIDGLSPGIYWVQYKATGTAFASDYVEVVVPDYTEAYTLTVNGGTGSGSYAVGDPVIITATVPSGQRFTGWTVNEGGVTVPNTNPASFTMPAGDVTVTANFEAIPTPPQPTTYRVTVQIDGSGTASASQTYATRGTKITLTATAEEGYHFKEWQVISGGVTIDDNSFTMPSGNVTIKAIFEQDPVHTHTWAAAWSKNTTHHWHDCTAQGCDISDVSQKDGYAAHTPGPAATCTEPQTCTVCGQEVVPALGHSFGEKVPQKDATTTSTGMKAHYLCSRCGNYFDENKNPTTADALTIPKKASGSGGGSYIPPAATYPPTVERPGEGGSTPTVSPSRPEQGDTVTVTPRPDTGYEVDQITVTDRNGRPVEVTMKPDGAYTFKQPSGKVTIRVTYRPIDRPWNNPFTDVSEGGWYYEAVQFVRERGLMNGYSDGQFRPNDTISRAQLAQILFNKEGRPTVNDGGFNDVDSSAWYADAVTWAAENGIVGGYGDGTFGPNDPITREQLAVMLWRYAGSPAATNKELHFNDADEISPFALEALRWAVENGILNGYGDGRLGPQGQATRAQVAQMLKNFIENQEENT